MNIPKTFLDEEVRCGFMVPTQIKQFWAAELEVLREIDRICTKHGIHYFADWGTLLGAVRHGGFVPWDDDLDIVMKREDYQRFLSVAKDEMHEGFCVQTYMDMKPGEWLFMGKVMSSERACFEPDYMRRFYNFPFIACVDVFVLDYVYADIKKEERRRELCLYLLAFAESIVSGNIKGEQIEKIIHIIHDRWQLEIEKKKDLIEMGRYIYELIEKQFAASKDEESECLCQLFPWGLKGVAPMYPKYLYEQSIRLPFECTSIPVPLDFDSMLKKRYGNYFRFDMGGSAHDYPCFETQKRNFYESLGMKEKKYSFSEDELEYRNKHRDANEQAFKDVVGECLKNLGVPQTVEEIIEYQQLAIELGELIESVKGEGFATVGCLEEYCESLYLMYEAAEVGKSENSSDVEKAFNRLGNSVDENIINRKNVVLMPSSEEHWKKLSTVYESLTKEGNTDVLVWPIDNYYKDYDGRLIEKAQIKYHFEENVNVIDCDSNYEKLRFLHPEMIIYTNGNDQWDDNISVDPAYYSGELAKCTEKLVYFFPYELENFEKADERAYQNMNYYVTVPGVVRADEIWVGSDVLRDRFIDKLTDFCGKDTAIHWEKCIVSVFFNTEKRLSMNTVRDKKKILYCINMGSLVATGEKGISKIKNNIKTIEDSGDLKITVCFFPDEENEFVQKKVNEIKNILEQITDGKVKVIEYRDVEICDYDAYFGGGCTYIVSLLEARIPVMLQAYD